MIQDSNLFTVDNLKDILKSFKITNVKITENKKIVFETENNKRITMFHEEDCCEKVFIYSKIDNLDVLIGKTIFDVTENISDVNETFNEETEKQYADDFFTWTFYNFSYKNCDDKTEKIEIIWFGTSNGYYDQGVQLVCEEIELECEEIELECEEIELECEEIELECEEIELECE